MSFLKNCLCCALFTVVPTFGLQSSWFHIPKPVLVLDALLLCELTEKKHESQLEWEVTHFLYLRGRNYPFLMTLKCYILGTIFSWQSLAGDKLILWQTIWFPVIHEKVVRLWVCDSCWPEAEGCCSMYISWPICPSCYICEKLAMSISLSWHVEKLSSRHQLRPSFSTLPRRYALVWYRRTARVAWNSIKAVGRCNASEFWKLPIMCALHPCILMAALFFWPFCFLLIS